MEKLLDVKGVVDRVGLSRTTIYIYAASGKFPQPVKLGEKKVRWVESEVNDWIQQKIDARNAQ